jgi:hypothetical protein
LAVGELVAIGFGPAARGGLLLLFQFHFVVPDQPHDHFGPPGIMPGLVPNIYTVGSSAWRGSQGQKWLVP